MRTCEQLGICQGRGCATCVPRVRISREEAIERNLPIYMRAVLRPAGAQCAPGQAPSVSHVGSDCEISGKPFAGRRVGVRAPTPDETPLSVEEVRIGLRAGVL